MTDKITLNGVSTFDNSVLNSINSNNAAISTAINNTLSRDGTAPNQMSAALDMNSQPILNLPAPGSPNSPVRLADITGESGAISISLSLAGDVTAPASSGVLTTTLSKIQGTTVSGITGTGDVVFSNAPTLVSPTLSGTVTLSSPVISNPTLTTPTLGVASATSINKVAITAPSSGATLTIANGKTLAVNNTLTLSGTDGTVQTFPNITDTVVGIAALQTLANKTLTSPILNTPTLNSPTISNPTLTGTAIEGFIATSSTAPTVGSSSSLILSTSITFVSGTTTISTIAPPAGIASSGGSVTLIPTGLWITDTSGNIALASTAVIGQALILYYDASTAKWYPSY